MKKALKIRVMFFHVSMVMLIFILSFIQISVPGSEAVGEPVVIIKFLEGEEVQSADVRPGEHGTVQFPGTVEATIPLGSNIQDIVVELRGYTRESWAVSVNPDSVQVDPGGTATFSATVSVPPETSIEISDILTIEGTARTFPGSGTYDVPPEQGTINIDQFYKFGLNCVETNKQGTYDDQLEFDLTITNLGNGKDQYSIQIENYEKLMANDITVTPSTPSLGIAEKSFLNVKIRVDIGSSSDCEGKHTIEVGVFSETQSQKEGTSFSKGYPLQIEVTAPKLLETVNDYSSLIVAILIVIIIAAIVIGKRKKYGY
jgi:hypothetical protein